MAFLRPFLESKSHTLTMHFQDDRTIQFQLFQRIYFCQRCTSQVFIKSGSQSPHTEENYVSWYFIGHSRQLWATSKKQSMYLNIKQISNLINVCSRSCKGPISLQNNLVFGRSLTEEDLRNFETFHKADSKKVRLWTKLSLDEI